MENTKKKDLECLQNDSMHHCLDSLVKNFILLQEAEKHKYALQRADSKFSGVVCGKSFENASFL